MAEMQRKAPNLRQYINKLPLEGDRVRMIGMAQGLSTPALLEMERQFAKQAPIAEAPAVTSMRELLRKNVRRIGLSIRTTNALLEAGIETVADLVKVHEVKRLKGIWKKGFAECESALKAMGLEWGMDVSQYGIGSVQPATEPAHAAKEPKPAYGKQTIGSLVSQLSEKARRIFQLKNQGKSNEEIASIIRDNAKNIYQIAWRNAKSIKPMLAECEPVTKEQFERHQALFEQMGYASWRGYVGSLNIVKAHEAKKKIRQKEKRERKRQERAQEEMHAGGKKTLGDLFNSMPEKSRMVLTCAMAGIGDKETAEKMGEGLQHFHVARIRKAAIRKLKERAGFGEIGPTVVEVAPADMTLYKLLTEHPKG